ncbi:MAG: alpha/beta hydrolase [Chloroflexota bacterium]|nr:alpha/beta hydrolase [Chloroflexota bacterium]
MTTTESSNRTMIEVAGSPVEMFSGGSGPPLLFLHGAGGNAGWQPYHEELAKSYTVYVPSQAGFNGTERPDWVYTITDLCHFNHAMVEALGLKDYVLMGSSMGGWVAAEMAAMSRDGIKALILVGAAGIKPEKSEIAEIFMVSAQTRMSQRFYDISQVPNREAYEREATPEEQLVAHSNQEMASRLCWRPYLHNPSLPHYLGRVDTPTLVVWGRQDAIIPVECGQMFEAAMPNATLKVIENCGHSPALERPSEFLAAVNEFLAGV